MGGGGQLTKQTVHSLKRKTFGSYRGFPPHDNTTEYAFPLTIGQTEAFRNVVTTKQLPIISNSFTLLKINQP